MASREVDWGGLRWILGPASGEAVRVGLTSGIERTVAKVLTIQIEMCT